jgi:hypothetical protein
MPPLGDMVSPQHTANGPRSVYGFSGGNQGKALPYRDSAPARGQGFLLPQGSPIYRPRPVHRGNHEKTGIFKGFPDCFLGETLGKVNIGDIFPEYQRGALKQEDHFTMAMGVQKDLHRQKIR